MGKGWSLYLKRKEEGMLPTPRKMVMLKLVPCRSWDLQSKDMAVHWEHKDTARESVPCPEAPLSTIPIGQTWPKVREWARVDAVLHSSALQAQSVVELDRGWVWRGRWQLPTTDVVKYSCIDWDIPLFSIDTMELLSMSLSLKNT